jgi:adenylylsulfate kinase-like enzyme
MTDSRGFCIQFTGRKASGKSTTARALASLFQKRGHSAVLFDTDDLPEMGRGRRVSRKEMISQVLEIVNSDRIAIYVSVSKDQKQRGAFSSVIGDGNLFVVHVSIPSAEAVKRQIVRFNVRRRKRNISFLWKRIKKMIFVKYVVPLSPDLMIVTTRHSPEENANIIYRSLVEQGFLEWEEMQ